MFHGLNPALAVITNVEHDHPDFFATPAQMHDAFRTFVETLAPGGSLIACADDDAARSIADEYRAEGGQATTYGISNAAADWRAADLRFDGELVTASIWRHGCRCAELKLSLPGAHNLLNALAALVAADERGVPPEESAKALENFRATARRFEVRGEREGAIVIDDYAHHPTEIRVNIEAARRRYPERADLGGLAAAYLFPHPAVLAWFPQRVRRRRQSSHHADLRRARSSDRRRDQPGIGRSDGGSWRGGLCAHIRRCR